MAYLTTSDGLHLFYKDWGNGPTLVFSHGWPLDADMWDTQMHHLLQRGYRVIAYDRRGHGRSDQRPRGHDIDTYADDLASFIEQLELTDVTLIGQGAGGGEIARFVGRHGTDRVSRVILISAALPGLRKTNTNPEGFPKAHFDAMRHEVATRRAEFTRQLAISWFNADSQIPGALAGIARRFHSSAMSASFDAAYTGISTLLETDFTTDLGAFDVPTLFIHGTGDLVVPFQCSTHVAAPLVRNSTTKFYPGAAHGLSLQSPEQISADIHAFLAD